MIKKYCTQLEKTNRVMDVDPKDCYFIVCWIDDVEGKLKNKLLLREEPSNIYFPKYYI